MTARRLLVLVTAGTALLGLACAADLGATAQQPAEPEGGDPAAAIAAVLAASRTENAVACALMVRGIDLQGWSQWDRVATDLLDVDSVASSHLRDLQRSRTTPVGIAPLEAALRDPVWCVRRVAASLLARQRDPAAIEVMRGAAGDSRADVRAVAMLALGLANATTETTLLLSHLKDEDATVRRWAAWALGTLEVEGTAAALIELLARDPDARVRQAAAWAVGEIEGS